MTGAPDPKPDQELPVLQLIETDGDAAVCQDGYCDVPHSPWD